MRLRVRRRVERWLRLAAYGLLAACAWLLMKAGTGDRGRGTEGLSSLPAWTRAPAMDTVRVQRGVAPPAWQREWLRALRGAGVVVLWRGSIPATAVEALPVGDPAGGTSVLVAAPAGASVQLSDSLGGLDSARAGRSGASFRLASRGERVRATVRGQPAAAAADSLSARHAVVLGAAAWESRFVVRALEERGWQVDARLGVAPGISVTQGRPLPLDTARQAVVVVLDSLAPSDAAALARFVAAGGGAVLSPDAARSVPGIAAGPVLAHVRPATLVFTASQPRAALARDPIAPRADAVVLEREAGQAVVAARRVGAGRVVQTGYSETWRWRMSGEGEAEEAHRAWWAGLAAAAAYQPTPIGRRREAGGRGEAPLADLVADLGPATSMAPAAAGPVPGILFPAMAGLLFLCLVAEWWSRRLRGAA